jgi:hypothetical protein
LKISDTSPGPEPGGRDQDPYKPKQDNWLVIYSIDFVHVFWSLSMVSAGLIEHGEFAETIIFIQPRSICLNDDIIWEKPCSSLSISCHI